MEVLIRQAKDEDFSMALAYYHTALPNITSLPAIDNLFLAIAKTSVVEAFYFSRAQTEYVHRHLLEALVASVLQASKGESKATKGAALVNLPFTDEEERWFEVFLLEGSGKDLSAARDTVMMRRIATGRFTEVLHSGRTSKKTGDGLSWNAMQDGIQHGLGSRLQVMKALP